MRKACRQCRGSFLRLKPAHAGDEGRTFRITTKTPDHGRPVTGGVRPTALRLPRPAILASATTTPCGLRIHRPSRRRHRIATRPCQPPRCPPRSTHTPTTEPRSPSADEPSADQAGSGNLSWWFRSWWFWEAPTLAVRAFSSNSQTARATIAAYAKEKQQGRCVPNNLPCRPGTAQHTKGPPNGAAVEQHFKFIRWIQAATGCGRPEALNSAPFAELRPEADQEKDFRRGFSSLPGDRPRRVRGECGWSRPAHRRWRGPNSSHPRVRSDSIARRWFA